MKKTVLVAVLASILCLDVTSAQEEDPETKLKTLKEKEGEVLSELEKLRSELKQLRDEIAATERELQRQKAADYIKKAKEKGVLARTSGDYRTCTVVYAEHNINSEQLGNLRADSEILVTRFVNSTWWEIVYNEATGYVISACLQPSGELLYLAQAASEGIATEEAEKGGTAAASMEHPKTGTVTAVKPKTAGKVGEKPKPPEGTREKAGLGESRQAFVARFGKPTQSFSVQDQFQSCPGMSHISQWWVMFENGRAFSITRHACRPGSLQPGAAKKEASQYFPADAVFVKKFVTDDGWAAEQYRSATLEGIFPPDSFVDCGGKRLAPGTFSYLLSPEREFWMVGLGTCL